ncbi:MAG: hypothetical protein E6157_04600 [Staphylococcus epidermidis]|nr:hypothetical protein [Staphylococcus epidermidis]
MYRPDAPRYPVPITRRRRLGCLPAPPASWMTRKGQTGNEMGYWRKPAP